MVVVLPWTCKHFSTRYRASESDTIEFEDIVTAENRAVSVCVPILYRMHTTCVYCENMVILGAVSYVPGFSGSHPG